MKKNPRFLLALPLLLLAGCVTHITTDVTQNPAPSEKFSNFQRIELAKIVVQPPYAGQEANEAALNKIQGNVDLKMAPLLTTWNAGPAETGSRTLRIEPTITEIKFVNGGARFWAGAMAGSSAVKLHAKIYDKDTGRLVASPEFYARAAAMAGAWSFGGADNAMLVRIANRLTDYLDSNYPAAVGGPSGAEPRSD